MNHRHFWEAGFHIFGIYGMTVDGVDKRCHCGNRNCLAVLKHPMMKNWQYAPVWSEEQMDIMEGQGNFDHGFGILCHEILVVDVDERNGGVQSYERLQERFPALAGCGLIVETGSGGGSRHRYFKVPEGVSMIPKSKEYPGIDFKNGNSFVVGPGSKHASGRTYNILHGSPEEIEMAPDDLLEFLKRPTHHRAELDGHPVDVHPNDLQDMLNHVPNTAHLDYEVWIRIGMALHHATGGDGYDLWVNWSAKSPKHDETQMPMKWHSFGKSGNPVTLGTLAFYAAENGWVMPVTFGPAPEFKFAEPAIAPVIDTMGIDLNRPPGAVGKVAQWIEDQTRRPRERLSAMAAIFAMGNVIGLHYTDDIDSIVSNLFLFGVAGSGTGKEGVQGAVREILKVAGLAPATHGALKSEQEIIRNLSRHQMAAYVVDEVGITMRKIKNAQSKGGASYLDGVVGTLMSAYSKGNGNLLLSGDVRETLKTELDKELSRVSAKLDDGDGNSYLENLQENLVHRISTLDNGLERPFLSLTGFTTMQTFNETIDFDNATNGFIGRSLLAVELETAPPAKEDYVSRPMPDWMQMMIQQLASGGTYDTNAPARVEFYKEKKIIPTEPDAAAMLKLTIKILDNWADNEKPETGLEALPLRGYEMISKISLILAAPSGLRTTEHVRWAFALVSNDIRTKINMVTANEKVKENPGLALKSKIMSLITDKQGETLGVIVNRCGKFRREDVEQALEAMVDTGDAYIEESTHKYNKKTIRKYHLT